MFKTFSGVSNLSGMFLPLLMTLQPVTLQAFITLTRKQQTIFRFSIDNLISSSLTDDGVIHGFKYILRGFPQEPFYLFCIVMCISRSPPKISRRSSHVIIFEKCKEPLKQALLKVCQRLFAILDCNTQKVL